jgi:hypothetical protein
MVLKYRKLKKSDVGKIIMIKTTNVTFPRYRWITRMNENGRFYFRAPKRGTYIRKLSLKQNEDYGVEKIVPKDAKVWDKNYSMFNKK